MYVLCSMHWLLLRCYGLQPYYISSFLMHRKGKLKNFVFITCMRFPSLNSFSKLLFNWIISLIIQLFCMTKNSLTMTFIIIFEKAFQNTSLYIYTFFGNVTSLGPLISSVVGWLLGWLIGRSVSRSVIIFVWYILSHLNHSCSWNNYFQNCLEPFIYSSTRTGSQLSFNQYMLYKMLLPGLHKVDQLKCKNFF